MSIKEDAKTFEVKFFLSEKENKAFEAHLAPFAGKKGPYAKRLLLDRIKVPANEPFDEGAKS